eukprot:TRINITY_DN59274_c0_g1_i1.p1 TRINITY_DN59274_c0_g1~~TRINITY_DN59274_c0_g1_i1.p1  ORF type:complete len:976 (-),score=96.50 TRINITY_DN59274_c0_g1_i1:48-2975(-)
MDLTSATAVLAATANPKPKVKPKKQCAEPTSIDSWFVEEGCAMKVPYRVRYSCSDDSKRVKDVIAGVFAHTEAVFSHFNPDSEVSQFNAAPLDVHVRMSDDMATVISCADVVFDASDGLFDVTAGGILRSWPAPFELGAPPSVVPDQPQTHSNPVASHHHQPVGVHLPVLSAQSSVVSQDMVTLPAVEVAPADVIPPLPASPPIRSPARATPPRRSGQLSRPASVRAPGAMALPALGRGSVVGASPVRTALIPVTASSEGHRAHGGRNGVQDTSSTGDGHGRSALQVGWRRCVDVQWDADGGPTWAKRVPTFVDLCGLAKGWAIDAVTTSLQHAGVLLAVVSWGGDVRAVGAPAPLAVPHPPGLAQLKASFDAREVVDSATLPTMASIVLPAGASAATSGDYSQLRQFGFGHIVDPKRGRLMRLSETLGQVTVVSHASCMVADAVATALMLCTQASAGTPSDTQDKTQDTSAAVPIPEALMSLVDGALVFDRQASKARSVVPSATDFWTSLPAEAAARLPWLRPASTPVAAKRAARWDDYTVTVFDTASPALSPTATVSSPATPNLVLPLSPCITATSPGPPSAAGASGKVHPPSRLHIAMTHSLPPLRRAPFAFAPHRHVPFFAATLQLVQNDAPEPPLQIVASSVVPLGPRVFSVQLMCTSRFTVAVTAAIPDLSAAAETIRRQGAACASPSAGRVQLRVRFIRGTEPLGHADGAAVAVVVGSATVGDHLVLVCQVGSDPVAKSALSTDSPARDALTHGGLCGAGGLVFLCGKARMVPASTSSAIAAIHPVVGSAGELWKVQYPVVVTAGKLGCIGYGFSVVSFDPLLYSLFTDDNALTRKVFPIARSSESGLHAEVPAPRVRLHFCGDPGATLWAWFADTSITDGEQQFMYIDTVATDVILGPEEAVVDCSVRQVGCISTVVDEHSGSSARRVMMHVLEPIASRVVGNAHRDGRGLGVVTVGRKIVRLKADE